MHWMFRAAIVSCLCLAAVWHSSDAATIQVADQSEWAARVFAGPDSHMPLDSEKYFIALDVTTDSRGIVIPSTISGALLELRHASPHWYMNALARSNGAYECTVIVASDHNVEVDLATLVEDWYWINWKMRDEKTPLRKDLAQNGLTDSFSILQALRAGFCNFVKSGELAHAVGIVSQYGRR